MTDPLANFLSKFCKEWQAGTDARLYVECHAGQAWVSLHQPLGHLPPPPNSSRRPPGPSRLRRSARRALARAAASATTVPSATAEIAVQTDDAETFATVAKAAVIPAPVLQPTQAPADKADHQAEQVLLTHHVPDALCPDGVYQSPAVQVVPPCHDVTQPAIPQLDGVEAVPVVRFTFKSEYREEDIEYSIRKILPEDAVSSLVSRARIGWTADHLCVLELEEVDHENFVWPDMNSSDEEVLRELERM